jgi:hypothetical protein
MSFLILVRQEWIYSNKSVLRVWPLYLQLLKFHIRLRRVFPFTALIHSHQLFKSNMHPDFLNSFHLPDNDGRTERLVQQLAFRVVEVLRSKFCPEALHSTQAVYVFPWSLL